MTFSDSFYCWAGEIGRRVRLRGVCRKAWGFDSPAQHHLSLTSGGTSVIPQRCDILEGIDQVGIQKFFEEQDIDIDPKVFLQNLEKLFEFIPKQPSSNFRKVKNYREDGSKLHF